MKKLLVLVMVFAMASLASATLKISVNGIVDPPDTSIILQPSDHVVLDVFGAGNTNDAVGIYMLIIGPGSIHGGTIVYGTGTLKSYTDAEAKAIEGEFPDVASYLASWGIEGLTDLSAMVIATAPPAPVLDGTLVDGIDFHCEGPGDVLIRLVGWDGDGNMFDFDTQVFPIPEPVTIALLGLGGLLLRRRMA